MQGFYKVIYTSYIESIVAVKKTGNSPIFATLPDSFVLTEDLNIKVTTFDSTLSKQKFDFNAVKKIEITLAQFFKNYSADYLLPVDLSYRNK
jgi:hypothetical protein